MEICSQKFCQGLILQSSPVGEKEKVGQADREIWLPCRFNKSVANHTEISEARIVFQNCSKLGKHEVFQKSYFLVVGSVKWNKNWLYFRSELINFDIVNNLGKISFCFRVLPIHWQMFKSIYPWILPTRCQYYTSPLVTTKNISRYCQMSVKGQKSPLLPVDKCSFTGHVLAWSRSFAS